MGWLNKPIYFAPNFCKYFLKGTFGGVKASFSNKEKLFYEYLSKTNL